MRLCTIQKKEVWNEILERGRWYFTESYYKNKESRYYELDTRRLSELDIISARKDESGGETFYPIKCVAGFRKLACSKFLSVKTIEDMYEVFYYDPYRDSDEHVIIELEVPEEFIMYSRQNQDAGLCLKTHIERLNGIYRYYTQTTQVYRNHYSYMLSSEKDVMSYLPYLDKVHVAAIHNVTTSFKNTTAYCDIETTYIGDYSPLWRETLRTQSFGRLINLRSSIMGDVEYIKYLQKSDGMGRVYYYMTVDNILECCNVYVTNVLKEKAEQHGIDLNKVKHLTYKQFEELYP